MNDDRHVDRYVRITNRERFLIFRALSIFGDACYTMGIAFDDRNCVMPSMKEVIALRRVFCEESWIKDYYIRHPNKVVSVQTMEQDAND